MCQEVMEPMKLSLLEARRLRGKTQEECAKALGVTVTTYRKLERRPELLKVRDLQILSDFLQIPIEDFLFLAENQ